MLNIKEKINAAIKTKLCGSHCKNMTRIEFKKYKNYQDRLLANWANDYCSAANIDIVIAT